jgi:hypothetical protein
MSTKDLYLEPMTTGMILDRSFRLYVQNFSLMIGLTAIVQLPILLFSVGVPLFQQQATTLVGLLGVFASLIAFVISAVVLTPWVTASATKAVSERFLGNQIAVMPALKFGTRFILRLVLIQLVVTLIVFAGMLLCLIPGIVFALSYSLVVPVTVLESSTSGGVIRQRSWDLVKGSRWKVFAVLAIIVVAQLLLSLSGSFFIQLFYGSTSGTGQVLSGLISSVAGLLTFPLQPIAVTLLYYDLRIRKEGFDLEMLSQAIGETT